jgi:hypothetical protein
MEDMRGKNRFQWLLLSALLAAGFARAGDDAEFSCVTNNGSITITYLNYLGTNECLVVPDYILGHPVTSMESIPRGQLTCVTNLVLPATIREIRTFWGNPKLVHVSVADDNPVYSSENGILFNKDKSELVMYPPAKEGNFKFPETVRSLQDAAFAQCWKITRIEVPHGIDTIPQHAFRGCSNLSDLTLSSTVKEIHGYAFEGCASLTSLNLPDAVEQIGPNVFSGCSNLREIAIPNGIRTISDRLFSGCIHLKYISIPDSVVSIEKFAFNGCESLTDIALPDGTIELSSWVFDGCDHLERIIFSPDHPTYSSLKGVWYDKAKTTLIRCPNGFAGEIEIPASVTNITPWALRGATKLSSVSVDAENPCYADVDGVLYDKELTKLIHCPQALTGTIRIPATMVDIPYSAFSETHALQGISVDDANPVFRSQGGLLYSKDRTRLIHCPQEVQGTVYLSSAVSKIPQNAFVRCDALTNIVVDTLNFSFSSVDGLLYNQRKFTLIACPGGRTGSVSLPATAHHNIGKVLGPIKSLEEIYVDPENDRYWDIDGVLYSRDDKTLILCPSGKTRLHVSASVSKIDPAALSDCLALERIEVAPGNMNYYVVDGVLFNMDRTRLLKCPASQKGHYVLPDSVSEICTGAFSGCTGLTEVTLSPQVETICSFAFKGCTGLKQINLPEDVETIEQASFAYCPKDVKFIFGGISRNMTSSDLFDHTAFRFYEPATN